MLLVGMSDSAARLDISAEDRELLRRYEEAIEGMRNGTLRGFASREGFQQSLLANPQS